MKPINFHKITRQISLLVLLFLIVPCASGQKKDSLTFAKKKQLIEAQKVAFITQKLELTPEEAQVFWPVYNEYTAKKELIMKENRLSKKGAANIRDLTDKEVQAIIDAQIITEEKLLALKKEYIVKFENVLPLIKVLKLQIAEKEFKKVLLKTLKAAQKPPLK